MPSNAFSVHLGVLLLDAEELSRIHARLRTGGPGRQYGLASLNRAALVMSVSAWESYVEELMRESVQALGPPAPPLGAWPAWNAYVMGLLGRFNTPNQANVGITHPQLHRSGGRSPDLEMAELHSGAGRATAHGCDDIPA